MTSKKFIKITILITIILLVFAATFIAVIDPYFHFHKPLNGLGYPMENEFYQNAGIARNFDYEAMIAGDSETQNILASQVENLWGYKTVKLPNPGAPFVETDKAVRLGLKNNDDLKLVIRQLDDFMLISDPYLMRYPKEDMYLYDDNPFNDVRYLLEKQTFVDAFTVLTYSRAGKKTISFDEYSNVDAYEVYGNFENLHAFIEESHTFGFEKDKEELIKTVKTNVNENIVKTALMYPDTDFYLFMPPYSACFWKEIYDNGLEETVLACERASLEELLPIDNIRIFSFMDCFDITTDWNNYSDEVHFKGEIDEYIIESMYKGERELTASNLDEYLDGMHSFYSSYNYDELLGN